MGFRAISSLFDDGAERLRFKAIAICTLLVAVNLAAWLWAVIAFHGRPALLGFALVAYGFGLRHAFDADHIAAIDNVTRKLMQDGKRPIATGLFFSLGHSTVVVGLTVVVALATAALQGHFALFRDVGAAVGTSISAVFLFGIAAANILVLMNVYRAVRAARDGAPGGDAEIDQLLAKRGLLGRFLLPAFALIERSWHMYPLGLLFGLGFDTATEVGVLGISATQAAHGLSIWAILVFPVLFTAGMSLLDATDSTVMVGAYGWAFIDPMRKLYYNMTMTFVSVVAAVVIGGIEGLGLLADKLSLHEPLWSVFIWLSGNLGALGYVIVGFFIASWIASVLAWRAKRHDLVEAPG